MPGPFPAKAASRMRETLAQNLGINLITIPISDVFDSYTKALAPAFTARAADCDRGKIFRARHPRGNYLMGSPINLARCC